MTWQDKAACKGLDTNIFFPEVGETTAKAKGVCAGCPVKAPCAEFVKKNIITEGIWAGNKATTILASSYSRHQLRQKALETRRDVVATMTLMGSTEAEISLKCGYSERNIRNDRKVLRERGILEQEVRIPKKMGRPPAKPLKPVKPPKSVKSVKPPKPSKIVKPPKIAIVDLGYPLRPDMLRALMDSGKTDQQIAIRTRVSLMKIQKMKRDLGIEK
jgi:WhiB family transcriptional regulator, redox-sensing transcriptional regulator